MGELPAPTVDPETGYFQAPYSVHGFSSSQQRGIIAIVCMAFLSVLATAFTIIRIAITRCTREDPDHHQFITLVFNLQIADFFQALSFTISTVWLHNEGILAPDLACSVQGFFLNLGDVSSGLFVLLIALQTNYTVRRGVTLPPRILWIIVGLIWSLAFGMSIGGIIRLPHEFYTAAGNWCWISPHFEPERLALHYVWIFIVDFGTPFLYIYPFVVMHKRNKTFKNLGTKNTHIMRKSRQVEVALPCYGLVYWVLTLPLAITRMWAYAGHEVPNDLLLVSGSLLVCSGWVNAIFYGVTRRVFEHGGPKVRQNQHDDTSEGFPFEDVEASGAIPLEDLEQSRTMPPEDVGNNTPASTDDAPLVRNRAPIALFPARSSSITSSDAEPCPPPLRKSRSSNVRARLWGQEYADRVQRELEAEKERRMPEVTRLQEAEKHEEAAEVAQEINDLKVQDPHFSEENWYGTRGYAERVEPDPTFPPFEDHEVRIVHQITVEEAPRKDDDPREDSMWFPG